jgi:hypothetical protein
VELDICICTRNPRPAVLRAALCSVARQRVPPGTFGVLVVDNGSTPALGVDVLDPLRSVGIPARLVLEGKAGVARARRRAVLETGSGWLLFVDDDNHLADDFVAAGLAFAHSREDVGAFGGKLLMPPSLRPPKWSEPFLPYLGIKDLGNAAIAGIADHWGPWEPPTAGAFVRRRLAEAYVECIERDPSALDLGRVGPGGLGSCEDSLMMRQAHRLGLLNAYLPWLSLQHHLDPERFRFGYLLRLMRAYGRSQVLLEAILARQRGVRLAVPDPYQRPTRFLRVLASAVNQARKLSLRWAVTTAAHRWETWRAWREYLRS